MKELDAFISYSSKDEEIGNAVCAGLEAAGIPCWIAPRNIRPGEEWSGAIVSAIDRCRVMVLIFSSRSNHSKQVTREVHRAFTNEVPVIPFRIEDISPTDALSYFLSSVQWLDATKLPFEQHLKQLIDTVRAVLQANSIEGASQKISELRPRATSKSSCAASDADASCARISYVASSGITIEMDIGEGQTLTFGRGASNKVILDDQRVSKIHAELSFQRGKLCVRDHHSKNGVYVNGRRINEQIVLASGDILNLSAHGPKISIVSIGVTATIADMETKPQR
jgi:hypothetical protein